MPIKFTIEHRFCIEISTLEAPTKVTEFLLDTGAQVNLITAKRAKDIGLKTINTRKFRKFFLVITSSYIQEKMALTKMVTLILFLKLTFGGKICRKDEITLHLESSKYQSTVSETMIETTLLRKNVDYVVKVQFMRVQREYQYCYPTLKSGEDPRCKLNLDAFLPLESIVSNEKDIDKYLVGPTCRKGTCDGDASSRCINPSSLVYSVLGLRNQSCGCPVVSTDRWGSDNSWEHKVIKQF